MLVSPMSISFHSPGGFPLNHDSRAVKVNPFSLRSSLFEVIRGGPQLWASIHSDRNVIALRILMEFCGDLYPGGKSI